MMVEDDDDGGVFFRSCQDLTPGFILFQKLPGINIRFMYFSEAVKESLKRVLIPRNEPAWRKN